MARRSIRHRFLVGSVASTLLALALFVVGSLVFVWLDDMDVMMADGDSFRDEAIELILGAMAIAAPLAIGAAWLMSVVLSRRIARPVEDAIRAARETTAHDLRRTLPMPARDDELRELVVALNDLFVRLDDGFGALARFAADASHELRTPLAIMATELEVALRYPRRTDEWEAAGRTGLEELRRLSALVEGLLTLARAGAEAPAARIKVRLVDCVDAVVAQLSATAEGAGVSLVGPVDETSDRVEGNSVMLETAIRNLVENAIIAAPRGGQVKVSLEASSSEVVVMVDDDGPGLGANAESLFVPFHRGSSGRADGAARRAGVGLGLAIARRVAISHDGRLDAGASPLGGARFRLRIPRATLD
ncbi:MAG: integral rane sensor signal transduction histidine kinase [Myxococcales bacterium]|nr:integral rane sensor signal transduction histidine kinase [Myxococcales bacterium]